MKTLIALLLLTQTALAQRSLNWQIKASNGGDAIAVNPANPNTVYWMQDSFRVSYDRGQTWYGRGPSLYARNISIHPVDTNTILVAGNGVQKSDDGGRTWRTTLPDVSIDGESIDWNYLHPDTVYFVDFLTSRFFLSADTGSTWTHRSTMPYGFTCALAANPVSPQILLVGAGSARIARSTDGGQTWTLVRPGNDYFSEVPKIVWDPIDPQRAYASMWADNYYSFSKSTDAGATWFQVGVYGLQTWALEIDPVTGDLYLGTLGFAGPDYGFDKQGIFRSADQGNSWQRLGFTTEPINTTMIKAGAQRTVFTINFASTGIDLISVSTLGDGKIQGQVTSFNNEPIENAIITVDETQDTVLVNNPAGSYMLSLLPGTYTLRCRAASAAQSIASVVVTAEGTTTVNFQLNLTKQTLVTQGRLTSDVDEDLTSEVRLYGRYANGTPLQDVRVTDSEFSFQLSSLNFADSIVITPRRSPFVSRTISPVPTGSEFSVELDLADVILVTLGGLGDNAERFLTPVRSAGLTAIHWDSDLRPGVPPTRFVTLSKRRTMIWLDGFGYATQSYLDTLERIVKAGHHIILAAQDLIQYRDTARIFRDYFGVQYGGDYTSDNVIEGALSHSIGQGLNFSISQVSQNSRDILTTTNPTAAPVFYYGSNQVGSPVAGYFIGNTGFGGKALVMGFGLRNATVSVRTAIFERTLTLFPKPIDPNVDPVPIDPNPTAFQLFQNYPNPFNPSTRIRYTLDRPLKVSLKIYNLLGQEVVTLFQGEQLKGDYRFIWDGLDSRGFPVSSGVYLYRLSTSLYSETKRMLLLK